MSPPRRDEPQRTVTPPHLRPRLYRAGVPLVLQSTLPPSQVALVGCQSKPPFPVGPQPELGQQEFESQREHTRWISVSGGTVCEFLLPRNYPDPCSSKDPGL